MHRVGSRKGGYATGRRSTRASTILTAGDDVAGPVLSQSFREHYKKKVADLEAKYADGRSAMLGLSGSCPRELRMWKDSLPAGTVMHPSRMEEPIWDQGDPSPPPTNCSTGAWQPSDLFRPHLRPTVDKYSLLPDQDNGEHEEVDGSWRGQAGNIMSGVPFQSTMAGVIVANAIVIGLETDNSEWVGWNAVENLFLFVFAAELIGKMFVHQPCAYFDWQGADFSWNVFDFAIVSLGFTDITLSFLFGSGSGGGIATVFRIVRLLRILRIFRIVKFLKQLYMLAFGFALAAIAVFWVTFLMVFVLYVCSIILVKTVGHAPPEDPQAEFLHGKFGTILRSMLTLFELMSSPTLEEYEAIMWERPCMAAFIIVFIIFGSFGMIALLTGVISESMFDKNNLRMEEERLERENMRKMLIRTCEALFDDLSSQCMTPSRAEGAFTWEVHELLPQIAALFESEGVDYAGEDLFQMLDIIDPDGSGAVTKEEFKFFIVQLAEGVRPLLVMRLFYAVQALTMKIDGVIKVVTGMSVQRRRPKTLEMSDGGPIHSEEFEKIMQKLNQLGHQVDGLGSRFDKMSNRVEEMSLREEERRVSVPAQRKGSTRALSGFWSHDGEDKKK